MVKGLAGSAFRWVPMVRHIILAGFVVLLPAGIQAQGRGGMASFSHAGAVAPRMVMPTARAGISQTVSGTRPVVRTGAPRLRAGMPVTRSTRRTGTRSRFAENDFARRRNCNSAPGLGFDEVHLAATCGPGRGGFRNGGLDAPFFFPFYEGGFSVPGATASLDDQSAADSAQPETTDADVRDSGRRYRTSQPVTAPAAEAASAAPVENDEFVFVRRDGTVFFAVAYAWEQGTLRYITSQGLRHTVKQDALDLDATRQFNEQRGMNFRLPA